mgnify:CR=1 FL=1
MLYTSFWHQKDRAKLVAIADVHIGSPQSRLKKLIDILQSLGEDTFLVFLGDIIDNAIIDSISNIYEQSMNPETALYEFIQLLDICQNRVLGIVSGNHEDRTYKKVGVDLPRLICKQRNIPYSEDILILDLQVGTRAKDSSKHRVQYTIVCGHGYSSARGIGAKVTANGRLIDIVTNGDVYLTAHTHQPSVVKIARFEADTRNKKIFQRESFLVTAPSWVGYESYAAKKFMHPAAKGYIVIELSGMKRDIAVEMR